MQTNTPQFGPILITVDEAAKRLSLCRRMIEYAITKGEIKVVRIGRAVRIPMASLEQFVASKSEA